MSLNTDKPVGESVFKKLNEKLRRRKKTLPPPGEENTMTSIDIPVEQAVENVPQTTVRAKRSIYTNKTCLQYCTLVSIFALAVVAGIVTLFGVVKVVFFQAKVLSPGCPTVLNRVCNAQGTCIDGRCVCGTLFSGRDCSQTQIIGYDIVSNTECYGNGIALPGVIIPPECEQVIEDGVYKGGWGSEACTVYVARVRSLIALAGGDASKVPSSSRVPSCLYATGLGANGRRKSTCPVDENGLVCGGRGNSSVGLEANYTNAGNGCQCDSLIALYDPQYIDWFTPEFYTYLLRTYNLGLRLYCGHLARVYNPVTGEPVKNIVVGYSLESDYVCRCSDEWKGIACTEGKCPVSPQTNQICSGNGHPNYGMGYSQHTPNSKIWGRDCAIECIDGYTTCGNKCYSNNNTIPGISPSVYNNRFCLNNIVCPKDAPVRCSDGTCVAIPTQTVFSKNCNLGYQYGSIDYERLDVAIQTYRCPNITNLDLYELCFQNTSIDNRVVGFNPQTQGGVLLDISNDESYRFQVNFTSPLMHYQFSVNVTGLYVKNFNGVVQYFNETDFISGYFSYNTSERWQTAVEWEMGLTTTDNLHYTLNPAPYNYSQATIFNQDFALIRVTNVNTMQRVVLSLVTSALKYQPVNDFVDVPNGVLVLYNSSPDPTTELVQLFWMDPSPTGDVLLTNEGCLSEPASCTWYVSILEGAIRNMGSSLYICSTLTTPYLPVTQNTPCSFDLSQLLSRMPGIFYTWSTDMYMSTENEDVLFLDVVNVYELPVAAGTPYTVEIYWEPSFVYRDTERVVSLGNVVFLTQDRGIGYPCACDISSLLGNASAMNNVWWKQNNTRFVTDLNIKVSDYVVYASYTTGSRKLKRGMVTSVNTDANVLDVNTLGVTEEVYYSRSRKVTVYEYLSGEFDGDMTVYPFKCPSGRYTTGDITTKELEVSCNCTYFSHLAGTSVIANDVVSYNCTCEDDATIKNVFGCVCNSGVCICGYPGNVVFIEQLKAAVAAVVNGGCRCLVYNGWQAVPVKETGSSLYFQQATNVNTYEHMFVFNAENLPEYIVVSFDSCVGSETFNITGGSIYFQAGASSVIYYDTPNNGSAVGNWVSACEYYLTLDYDPNIVFTNLTIRSNSIFPMVNITLSFAKYGYSLIQTELGLGKNVTVNATSNSNSAANILFLGDVGWHSSYSLHENPVIVQISFQMQYYASHYLVVFNKAGLTVGGFKIPLHVYVQGSNNNIRWYDLDNFQIYIDPEWQQDPYTDERYQVIRNISAMNETFSLYRFMTFGSTLNILHVDIFSNTTCLCEASQLTDPNTSYIISDPYFGVAIQLSGLDGLENITAQMETYYHRINSVSSTVGCIAVNNCTIYNVDVTSDGICNDVIYQAYRLGITPGNIVVDEVVYSPNNISFLTSEFVYHGYLFSQGITTGVDAVQVYTLLNTTLDGTALLDFYNLYGGAVTLYSLDTGLYVYFLRAGTPYIIGYGSSQFNFTWVENTIYIKYTAYDDVYGDLINSGAACLAGYDYTDCGCSTRIPVLFPGLTCYTENPLSRYRGFDGAPASLFYRSYYVSNLQQLENTWYASIQRLKLTLEKPVVTMRTCGDEVCENGKLYKCKNGRCVKHKSECALLYTCPGNGCVKMTDASDYSAYRCACKPTSNGDACQYTWCRPATPLALPTETRTPVSEECVCGGPPPFTIKPPVLNQKAYYTNEELEIINRRPNGACAPLSNLDIGYICVMPGNAPFPQRVLREARMHISDLLPDNYQIIYTSCPCCRKGYYGECVLLTDDISSKNIFTGENIYKTYTNPFTGKREQFRWDNGICSYDDLVYRCPNGKCVANRVQCQLSAVQFPLCNDRGNCMADASCLCAPGYSTFLINQEFTDKIRYPYEWDYKRNSTNPVAWVMNNNWRLYALNQCAARNCDYDNCKIPIGCKTGTYARNFEDAEVLCKNNGLCAKSASLCYSETGLTPPKPCSGNGIVRQKDVTGEPYCQCGTPISPLLDVATVTETVLLKPNGWGGPSCDDYFASLNGPLFWSPWDFRNNQPYISKQTGEILPGKWFFGQGNVLIGPAPEDYGIWSKCCQGYTGFDDCPITPCKVGENILCYEAQACLDYSPTAPLLYVCNNHGVARADGTCLCNSDVEEGSVYTSSPTDFATEGCYTKKVCLVSAINNRPCNEPDPCSDPKAWTYPFTRCPFLEQQWATAMNGATMLNSYAQLAALDINVDETQNMVERSLGNIALRVQDAVSSYGGCVCIYPGDTQTSRCCMISNNKVYYYKQAFQTPYYMPVVPNLLYPTIFAGPTYPIGRDQLKYYFKKDDVINFQLIYTNVTIAAIRIMSSGNAALVLQDSVGRQICPTIRLINYDIDYDYPIFNWNAGRLGDALDCTPVYQCVPGISFPDYQAICGVKTNTDQCMLYREQSCEDLGYIYWPDDSLSSYPGCLRVDDADGCNCCKILSPPQLTQDGVLRFKVIDGSTFISKVRVYGIKPTVIDTPPLMRQTVSVGLGYNSTCQDIRFLQSRLGADNDYYTQNQTAGRTFDQSRTMCQEFGSYMAVGRVEGSSLNGDVDSIRELRRVCGNIRNGKGNCWVDAKSLASTLTIPRKVLYQPSCDKWGCYMSNLFYSNNSAIDYKTSVFPALGRTDVQTAITDYLPRLSNIYKLYKVNFDYYATTYCDASYTTCTKATGSPTTGDYFETDVMFTLFNGFSTTYTYSADPSRMATNNMWSNNAYRGFITYDAFVNTYQMFPVVSSLGIWKIQTIRVNGAFPIRFTMAADPIQCIFSPGQIAQFPYKDSEFRAVATKTLVYAAIGMPYLVNMLDFNEASFFANIGGICSQINGYLGAIYETRGVVTDQLACMRSKNCPNTSCDSENYAWPQSYVNCCWAEAYGFRIVLTRRECATSVLVSNFRAAYCPTVNGKNYQNLVNWKQIIDQPNRNTIVLKPKCTYTVIDPSSIREACDGGTPKTITFNSETMLQNPFQMLKGHNCVLARQVNYISDTNAPSMLTSFVKLNLFSQDFDTGEIGINKMFGYVEHPYMPLYFTGDAFPWTVIARPPSSAVVNTVMNYQSSAGALIAARPIYLIEKNRFTLPMYENTGFIYAPDVLPCSSCRTARTNTCYWDQMFYSLVTWKSLFTCPLPDIFIKLPSQDRTLLDSYRITNTVSSLAVYMHQTLYIQNYTVNPFPKVQWYMPECVSVSNASVFNIQFCDQLNNNICQYDYSKYAVVAGTQCDVCPTSTGIGANPVFNTTCSSDNPLANRTLNPYPWLIYDNYVRGTLTEFAKTVNVEPTVFNFNNTSVIFGNPAAYRYWTQGGTGYCSRAGSLSFNTLAETNWKCFCPSCIWPVSCGRQVNPKTNKVSRLCAVRSEYCNPELNETDVAGAPMRVSGIPPIMLPVDPSLSRTDPTCGFNIPLATYNKMDRFGGPQSDLELYSKFVLIGPSYIRLQTTTHVPRWFNGGKTPIDFVFQWNQEATISGYYMLELCSSCHSAFMEVLIYPLNDDYSFPLIYLSKNLTMVNGIMSLFETSFNITVADTGSFTDNGMTFPLIVFAGIGFRFFNIDPGATITLYNPLVTTQSTRQECETREIPDWVEPPLNIESSVAERLCPISEDDLEVYPECELGTCCCDSSTGGPSCDCPATYSTKYAGRKLVCNGMGDENRLVKGYDGNFYTTGIDEEAGCYTGGLPSGEKFSDCKVVDIGRYLQTLFIDGAIFDYPSVYPQNYMPNSGSLFRFYDENIESRNYTDSKASCASQGMNLPYTFTLQELNQFILTARDFVPIFMGVDTKNSVANSWPYDDTDNGYFLLDPDLETSSIQGVCAIDVCDVVNFNNYAYSAVITGGTLPTLLHDGNTVAMTVQSGTYLITWSQNSDLGITLIVFGVATSGPTVTCDGGSCGAFVVSSIIMTAVCRCPTRSMSFVVGTSNEISEVQIFNEVDSTRSSVYIY